MGVCSRRHVGRVTLSRCAPNLYYARASASIWLDLVAFTILCSPRSPSPTRNHVGTHL